MTICTAVKIFNIVCASIDGAALYSSPNRTNNTGTVVPKAAAQGLLIKGEG
jgi:hypothetical protein